LHGRTCPFLHSPIFILSLSTTPPYYYKIDIRRKGEGRKGKKKEKKKEKKRGREETSAAFSPSPFPSLCPFFVSLPLLSKEKGKKRKKRRGKGAEGLERGRLFLYLLIGKEKREKGEKKEKKKGKKKRGPLPRATHYLLRL